MNMNQELFHGILFFAYTALGLFLIEQCKKKDKKIEELKEENRRFTKFYEHGGIIKTWVKEGEVKPMVDIKFPMTPNLWNYINSGEQIFKQKHENSKIHEKYQRLKRKLFNG